MKIAEIKFRNDQGEVLAHLKLTVIVNNVRCAAAKRSALNAQVNVQSVLIPMCEKLRRI